MEMPSSFILGAIITIILVGGAFIIGYKIMVGINEIGLQKRAIDIRESVDELVDYLYYQAEGSSKVMLLKLSEREIVCFINKEDIAGFLEENRDFMDEYDYLFLRSSIVESNKPYNYYYHKRGFDGMFYTIDNLIPRESFCINKSARIYLVNEGTYVSVSLLRDEVNE